MGGGGNKKIQNKGIVSKFFKMKHQPYKAFFLFSYRSSSEIHKRSNILMTIKVSTTNSVNKTLQHKKALWDLETLCGDSRGYGGGEGVSDSSETLSVFFFCFCLSLFLSRSIRIHRILSHCDEEWNPGRGERF